MTSNVPKYVMLEKAVGQTPLDVIVDFKTKHPKYADLKMAYAGRLDPLASGSLLVLLGEECKHQKCYHSLDKEYVFEILFGIQSDTGDVLGIVAWEEPPTIAKQAIEETLYNIKGPLTLPYPTFSAKTVLGKPLHTWTLENRLAEINIPNKQSLIYDLKLIELRSEPAETVFTQVRSKIATIPPVTDARKALGADFRRTDVYASWEHAKINCTKAELQIATIQCRCSSGTYMRSLAELIAKKLSATGIAYSIHRTILGRFQPIPLLGGIWKKRY